MILIYPCCNLNFVFEVWLCPTVTAIATDQSTSSARHHLCTCRELDLASKFAKLEDASYKELKGMMSEQSDLPVEVFDAFLAKIFKRSK
jgi:hypothetical protein